MSSSSREEFGGVVAARSLREELASLKIDRTDEPRAPARTERPRLADTAQKPSSGRTPKRGPGFGLRLLTLLLWMIPLGMVGGGGYYAYLQYSKMRDKPEVVTAPVESMTTEQSQKVLSAKGYIKSRYQAMIGARTPGRVERMLVEEGSQVHKGDLLAVLEHNDMDALLESRKASVARVEADLEEAKFELKEKERKAKLQTMLLARKQVALDVAEEAISLRDVASARLRSVEANVKLMRASTREIEETIRNMSIFAPFDGTVVEKGAEEGETITPGGMGAASGRGSVVTLADLGHLEVETDLTERDVSRVKIGQPAYVEVMAVPDKRYRARLRQIIPMGDRARGTVKLKVEVLDADEKLFPELEAKVHFLPDSAHISPGSSQASLFISRKAIVEENGETHAWVVDSTGRVRKRTIEAVVTSDDLARIKTGLAIGENVVVAPPKTLKDGQEVKISD